MSVGITSWRKCTILNGASLSDAIWMQGYLLLAMRQAANTAGTAFTFQASYDGGATFEDLQTDSAELSITKSATVAQHFYLPDAKRVFGPTHIKVRTGTSGSASAQSADVVVWVCLEDVEAANGG